MYNVRSTVYGVRCTLYDVRCTVYDVRCTMYDVQCMVDLYNDRHAAHKYTLVLSRRKAVARGGEAELGARVVGHVLLERDFLEDAVVESHDEEARVVAVGAENGLAHAEGVGAPPVEVHLAGEEDGRAGTHWGRPRRRGRMPRVAHAA